MISTGKLFEGQEFFCLLFELSNDPILTFKDFLFVDCNKATLTLLGFSPKEEFETAIDEVLAPEYQSDGEKSSEKVKTMMNEAYQKGHHRFKWVHLNKKKEEVYVDVTLTQIPY
ncbi:MAG: hypothetical protein PWP52_2107 [Bacteroidales bacterium]|jgi:PAS domain-containing protein|nr:hypothetical protein [Bacteroidales bacterium]